MQYEGVVDIFQTARILRTQRPAMVQTEVKLYILYKVSLEWFTVVKGTAIYQKQKFG